MKFLRLFIFLMLMTKTLFAAIETDLPNLSSWVFSGVATNENGDQFGYFFQMQRQGVDFHVKTALIDGQTNRLLFFYEGKEFIEAFNSVDWQVGQAFMRHNTINDSWVFGVKLKDNQGFNFKVDMKKEQDNDRLELKPGLAVQAMETTRLNGHIQTGTETETKEQFVTANKAWFAKIWLTKPQQSGSAISTTFCRLNNDNGFYAANFKGPTRQQSSLTGWRDATGTTLKMSKYISIKSLANNECLLHVGLPKLDLKLINSLKDEAQFAHALAGFSTQMPMGFCFVDEQALLPVA